ncbi:MAG TPA: glucose-6-phosphate dehydrogenase [Verrucomicrobiae bacterium]|nr:glucose-6-phosphate dehydrogenase [Verrucomicrobiae bacterium]
MNTIQSDALVFFGATGDLAYKKIFPNLQAMLKRSNLNCPVIGVAKADWTLDQFRARAKDSLEKHGGLDPAAWEKLSRLLLYVGGDYQDDRTFQNLRKALGKAEHPSHYLAIPPSLFGEVVQQLVKSGCAKGSRVVVEKPFGNDLASAEALNRILQSSFAEQDIFRIDHYLGKRPVHNMLVGRFANPFIENQLNRNFVESVQITMAEDFGVQGRGAFYDQTGTIRDVVQNHLFQVLCNLAMEPPVRADSEAIRDEKVKVLQAVSPLSTVNLVRGQFRGYLNEGGVASDSKTETFAALKLEVNSWRWKGVPFYIRAGKCLPVTSTEVVITFKQPPALIDLAKIKRDHLRFRVSPVVGLAVGLNVMAPGEEMRGEFAEIVGHRPPQASEMDAYERVLTDAMAGDATLFARQDYVEEAWRIVDPALKAGTPVYPYEPGTWGPAEVAKQVCPEGGWHDPITEPAPVTAKAAG